MSVLEGGGAVNRDIAALRVRLEALYKRMKQLRMPKKRAKGKR